MMIATFFCGDFSTCSCSLYLMPNLIMGKGLDAAAGDNSSCL